MFETLSHQHNHNTPAVTASAACCTHDHHNTDTLAHLPTSRSEFATMSSVKATEPSLEPPPRPPSSPGEEDEDEEEVLFQPRGKQQKRPSSSPSLPQDEGPVVSRAREEEPRRRATSTASNTSDHSHGVLLTSPSARTPILDDNRPQVAAPPSSELIVPVPAAQNLALSAPTAVQEEAARERMS